MQIVYDPISLRLYLEGTLDPGDLTSYPTDATKHLKGDGSWGQLAAAEVPNSLITDAMVAAANKDGAAGTASMRTLGTGALTACAGNDVRLDKRVASAAGTSSVTIASTTAAGATSVLALPSTTYLNRLVRLEFRAASFRISPAVAAHVALLDFWLDDGAGTDYGISGQITGNVAGQYSSTVCSIWIEITPAAGAHVYSVRGWKTAAGDTADVVAGAGGAGNFANMKLTATYV